MSALIVEVTEGKLEGCTRKNLDGQEILAFLGVPFAKPPIGELRFKAPQAPEKWQGVRSCHDETRLCIQRDLLDDLKIKGSEDCLYLNIFTHSVTPTVRRPVLVYFHGGAFTSGSNETRIYGPDFLLTQDIVLVTVNYRLGMLGYLCVEDAALDVPGNAGLKDQTAALKWIQRNIEKFGGDPTNVTIGGCSAGSASVHYHILSPLSKGLFHKAILQSGVVLNPWACTKNDVMDVVRLVGMDAIDENEAMDSLGKMSVREIYEIQEKYTAAKGTDAILFGPVVERPNPTAFITRQPQELLLEGSYNKVPMMLGYCSREGLLALFNKLVKKGDANKKDFKDYLSACTRLAKDSAPFKDLLENVNALYFAAGDPEAEILLLSDILFNAGIIMAAEIHARSVPVYLYRFSLDAGLNLLKRYSKMTNPGACHGDDVGYMFKTDLAPFAEKDSIEEITVGRFVRLITNFMKTGEPSPRGCDLDVVWKPIEDTVVNFLDIGESLIVRSNPEGNRITFWKKLAQILRAHNANY